MRWMLSAQILAMQQLTPATARVIVSDEVSIQSDGEARSSRSSQRLRRFRPDTQRRENM